MRLQHCAIRSQRSQNTRLRPSTPAGARLHLFEVRLLAFFVPLLFHWHCQLFKRVLHRCAFSFDQRGLNRFHTIQPMHLVARYLQHRQFREVRISPQSRSTQFTTAFRQHSLCPDSRPATTSDATMRFRSHSNGANRLIEIIDVETAARPERQMLRGCARGHRRDLRHDASRRGAARSAAITGTAPRKHRKATAPSLELQRNQRRQLPFIDALPTKGSARASTLLSARHARPRPICLRRDWPIWRRLQASCNA